ncbi:MAG TPA: hypothetical protein VMX95_09085 [Thermodesulfobacteriota bacterium]|nr:hypothetical protein [Thermodesulfobacteriota bacterium]
MNLFQKFVEGWETYLNQDPVLRERTAHFKSTLEEGKAVVMVEVEGRGVFSVELKEKGFQIRSGKAALPLLGWKVPLSLFKEALLGKERILYALMDKGCRLSFDTPHFTHWDGITALEIILLACEMVKKSPEMRKIAEEM